MTETGLTTTKRSARAGTLLAAMRGLASDPSHDGIARRTALFAFGVRVASAAIAYLAQIVLARWMGTTEYGIYVFVWTWVLVLGNISGLGFGLASARFVSQHGERREWDLLRGYLRLSRGAGLFAGSSVAVIGIVAVLSLGDTAGNPFVWPLLLALVCLPLFALSETQDGIARALNAPATGLLPPYVLRPLLLLGLMVASHAAGWPSTAAAALVCAIVATWTAALVQAYALHRAFRRRTPAGPRRYAPGPWLAASLPLCLADGAHVLHLNIDVLILAAFVSPDQVGIYYAVTKTLVLGAFVAFAVGAAVAHRYAEYHVAGDRERLQAFVLKTALWTFWPTVAAVGLMLALGRPFLSLFGAEFVDGYPVMLILSLGVIVRAALGPTDRLLAVLGAQAAYARIVVTSLALAAGLLILLVPLLGVMGAAVAMSVSTIAEGLMLAWVARTRLGLRVGIWSALRAR